MATHLQFEKAWLPRETTLRSLTHAQGHTRAAEQWPGAVRLLCSFSHQIDVIVSISISNSFLSCTKVHTEMCCYVFCCCRNYLRLEICKQKHIYPKVWETRTLSSVVK